MKPVLADEGKDEWMGGAFAPFERVAIVGVGMMGGSLGLELRARGLARHVIGIDQSADTLALARERGAIDEGTLNAPGGVSEADCVVFATPVGVIPPLLQSLAPHIRPGTLITDLGSTKSRIVETGLRQYGARFVGGHPMSGSPASGMSAALPDLFSGAAWAVVREREFTFKSDPFAARVAGLASALGARPLALDAARHDRLVALVSHLTHVISFAFAATVAGDADAELARSLAGGSYRDLMRIAGADPALWRDIFRDNRDCLLAEIAAFETRLQVLRRAIEEDDFRQDLQD